MLMQDEIGAGWAERRGAVGRCNMAAREGHQMLLLGVVVLFIPVAVPCPNLCSCSQNTVICTGQGLTRIPAGIPTDTHRLQLMDNHIHMIEDNAFDNLLQLERL
ncbi:unnamed protein product [Toxocara canis]|uniref:LRRNT domain-containing protein n=1 Tax=Toxocara canis TaxID=6265 RepID=A0A183USY2_TOXCA|nr:unnamed protein product [Toxocara canis]